MKFTKLKIDDENANGEHLIYDEADNLMAIVPSEEFACYLVDVINEYASGCPSCHFNENPIK